VGADALFEEVALRAQSLAAQPYRSAQWRLPPALAQLDYDEYRRIVFRRERTIWQEPESAYRVQLCHLGYQFQRQVAIYLVTAGHPLLVPFSTEYFQYGGRLADVEAAELPGFAGFRVLYRLNAPEKWDEVLSFLGASYFRALSRDQVYGASARAVALNTATDSPEEFPDFTAHWLVQPAAPGDPLVIISLLDGESLTGAWRFMLHPDDATQLDVTARLYFRRKVEKLGLAPLTSMFLYGEGTPGRTDAARPEVHDSDGLLLVNGDGERILRPLRNPSRLAISRYELHDPRGFGLLQRDRDYDHYRDDEAQYHRRPSIWVEPGEGFRFGDGAVELAEFPSTAEGPDNIAAYWVPASAPEASAQMDLRYRLVFASGDPPGSRGGKVVATCGCNDGRRHTYSIEFAGGLLDNIADSIEPVITTSSGVIERVRIARDATTRRWTLEFELDQPAPHPANLRAYLKWGSDVLTETWSMPCPATIP